MYLPAVTTYPFLRPLAWLYGLGVWLRDVAFRRGWLRQVSFDDQVSTIAVGNIAAGGTGKTPHVEYLIRLLQQEGIGPIAVLSRGYRRRSRGFVVAVPGIEPLRLGDESYQLYTKFPAVTVAVDADRVHGVRQLLSLPEATGAEQPHVPCRPRVILLDDAMQHRYIKPGLTVGLTSFNRILYKDTLLPEGRLREPARGMQRADVVVVSKCPSTLRDEVTVELNSRLPLRARQPLFYSAYRYSAPVNLATRRPTPLDATTEVLMMSGIADPKVLERYLSLHYRVMDRLTFGDHHSFSAADIRKIQQRLDGINGLGHCTAGSSVPPVVVTTEKDVARLDRHPALTPELKQRIYYLPTEVYFPTGQDAQFNQIILNYVRQNQANG